MSGYRRMLHDQTAYSGPAACTLTACHMARGLLSDARLRSADLLSDAGLALLDEYVQAGCASWRQLEQPGVRYVREVLREDQLLGERLCLREDHSTTLQETRDAGGELVCEATASALWRWLEQPGETCCAVTTADAYTFLIAPPLLDDAAYSVLDTHAGTLEHRQHAISGLARRMEQDRRGGGLVWCTLFASEVAEFVQLYCTTSPRAQVDLSILKLCSTDTESKDGSRLA